MVKKFIRTSQIDDGMFSSERIVSIEVDGNKLMLIVDREDLSGANLRVTLLEQHNGRSLINLPREPVGGSARMIVPTSMLLAE